MNALKGVGGERSAVARQLGDAVAAMTYRPRDFPTWHFRMVNDNDRNAAIESGIASLDLDGKIVFEIGTGSGLVALLFAKYGARHVYTCEANATMAAIAKKTVAKTGLAHRITILPFTSTLVLDRRLLPTSPDIIFTETLDTAVLGEGFVSIAGDISRIARADTLILPEAIRQYCVPIESELIDGMNRVDSACGFDVSALNDYSTFNFFSVQSQLYPVRQLGHQALIRTYSYREPVPPSVVPVVLDEAGTLHGFLSWFEADFAGHCVTNAPGKRSHWKQAFHPLPAPLAVSAGSMLDVLFDDYGQAMVTPASR
jgi:type I protein arginine methyltransferase